MDATPAALAQLKQQGWKPHTRYEGPRGCGKTKMAEQDARELQKQNYETMIIETDQGCDELWKRLTRAAP